MMHTILTTTTPKRHIINDAPNTLRTTTNIVRSQSIEVSTSTTTTTTSNQSHAASNQMNTHDAAHCACVINQNVK